MSKVFLIGATGGVGHRLYPILRQNGHDVIGLHRKPEQADDLIAAGAEAALGDIIDMSPDDLAAAARGADVIVYSAGAAGSGLDRTTAIDGDGPTKAIIAARQLGITRLYIVSAFPDSGRGQVPNAGIEHYMAEKRRADVAVASSGLDWVILRPGTLVHEDGDGHVSLGQAIPYGDVARGNVARTLAALIDRPEIRHAILELTDGPTPVADAVTLLVRAPVKQ